MKKLLTIGFGQCFGSAIPIIIWAIMGKFHGDSFANGMSFTYPYQFIFLLLWHVTFHGNIKYELKDKLGSRNNSKTALMLGTIIGFIISVVSIINVDVIGTYVGVQSKVDRWAFIFGLLSMSIDWAVYYYGEQYQYYGEEKRGSRFIVAWYLFKLALVLITAAPIFDYVTACIFILSAEFVVFTILFVKHALPRRLSFSIVQGIKYSVHDIFYCGFMTIIYFIGVHDMSVEDVNFLAAFNLMVLCTDTQWDVNGSAIDVSVTQYICDGEFDKNRKKIFGTNAVFSLLVMCTSFIMAAFMLLLYKDVNPVTAMVILMIALSTMVPYGIIDTMSVYISVAYPNVWIGVLTVYKYAIRLLSQLLIASPYSISIALPVAVVFDLPFRILLYRRARRKAVKSCE